MQKASASLGISADEWLAKASNRALLALVMQTADIEAILNAPRGGWAQVAVELARANAFAIGKVLFSKPLMQITEERIAEVLKAAVDTLFTKEDPITKLAVAEVIAQAQVEISGDPRIKLADKPRDVKFSLLLFL